jgi:hypothetical protein
VLVHKEHVHLQCYFVCNCGTIQRTRCMYSQAGFPSARLAKHCGNASGVIYSQKGLLHISCHAPGPLFASADFCQCPCASVLYMCTVARHGLGAFCSGVLTLE